MFKSDNRSSKYKTRKLVIYSINHFVQLFHYVLVTLVYGRFTPYSDNHGEALG